MGVIKKIRAWNINRKQADLNKQYYLFGMSDELLEKQVKLNIERNKHDIPDKKYLDDEGFVQ